MRLGKMNLGAKRAKMSAVLGPVMAVGCKPDGHPYIRDGEDMGLQITVRICN